MNYADFSLANSINLRSVQISARFDAG
jgi:hypothetical protein